MEGFLSWLSALFTLSVFIVVEMFQEPQEQSPELFPSPREHPHCPASRVRLLLLLSPRCCGPPGISQGVWPHAGEHLGPEGQGAGRACWPARWARAAFWEVFLRNTIQGPDLSGWSTLLWVRWPLGCLVVPQAPCCDNTSKIVTPLLCLGIVLL